MRSRRDLKLLSAPHCSHAFLTNHELIYALISNFFIRNVITKNELVGVCCLHVYLCVCVHVRLRGIRDSVRDSVPSPVHYSGFGSEPIFYYSTGFSLKYWTNYVNYKRQSFQASKKLVIHNLHQKSRFLAQFPRK